MADLEFHGQLEAITMIAQLAMRAVDGPFLRINLHATREGERYHIDAVYRSNEFDGDRKFEYPDQIPMIFEKLSRIHRDKNLRYFKRCRMSIAAEHQVAADYDFGEGYLEGVSVT